MQQALLAMEAAVAALHILTVPGLPAHGKVWAVALFLSQHFYCCSGNPCCLPLCLLQTAPTDCQLPKSATASPLPFVLPSPVYNEDLMESIIEVTRFHITSNAYPFHDARLRAAHRPELGVTDEGAEAEGGNGPGNTKRRTGGGAMGAMKKGKSVGLRWSG